MRPLFQSASILPFAGAWATRPAAAPSRPQIAPDAQSLSCAPAPQPL